MKTSFLSWLAIAALVLALPSPASACGGFFCSQSTGGQPVDQAGEDIAYIVEDDGSLTMIVRIVYSGRPDNFAWIVPIPVAPTAIELGPDALFQQLAPLTSPQFALTGSTEGTCRTSPECDYPSSGCALGCAYEASPPSFGSARDGGGGGASSDGGVMVLQEGTVGAYETVVLSGGTAEELHAWLTANGYDLPDAAIPVLADYVAARQLFVALRLRGSATTDAIQPILLRLPHEQPCLPIRLTAIATVPGLPIRAYFIGSAPFVPTNYALLDPPYVPGLFTNATLWPQQWSDAIDAAGGHAFVRDFAGPPPTIALALPSLSDLAAAEPNRFFDETILFRQYPREAVIAIAPDFLDPPAGDDIASYVDRCAFDSCEIAPVRWDPAGFVTALEEQVRAPRQRIQDALGSAAWLTRLYTAMDADEMTLDPEFRGDSGVGAQSNVHVANQVTECTSDVYLEGAGVRMDMPDGTSARISEANPTLNADDVCRLRGATGERARGCTAMFGTSPATRPALVLLAILGALAVRRRR